MTKKISFLNRELQTALIHGRIIKNLANEGKEMPSWLIASRIVSRNDLALAISLKTKAVQDEL